MRGMVYRGNKKLFLEELPEPFPKALEVQVQVHYCGICATDIEEYMYGPVFIDSDKPNRITGEMMPLVTGHEITGIVTRVGEKVEPDLIGKRVVLNGMLSCDSCDRCYEGRTTQCLGAAAVGFARNGGLAELLTWPADHIVELPDSISSLSSALVEPASVAAHAVTSSAVKKGDRVAVIGAGTVGILACQISLAMGAVVDAFDIRQEPLDLLNKIDGISAYRVDSPHYASAVEGASVGGGYDVVLDTAGHSSTPVESVKLARHGGKIILVAIYTELTNIDFNALVSTEKQIIGSLAYEQKDVELVVELLSTGQLETEMLISEVISLDDVLSVGFAKMMAESKDVYRILVNPRV